MRSTLPAATLLLLAACGGGERPRVAAGRVSLPVAPALPSGVPSVMGQDAAALTRLFGQPEAEVREGAARKLQFAGPVCILDAYLYPKADALPRVAWLDARQPDGSPIDRASCVAALAHGRR